MSLEATLITDLLKKYLSLLIEDYDASFLHSSLLQGKLKLDEFKINCHNLNALNKDGAFTGIDVDSLELDVSLQHRQPFVSAKLQSLTLDLSDEPFPKWMINEDPELFSPYSALSGVVAPSHAILRENEDILRTPRMFADDGIPKESQTPNSKQRGSRDTPSTEPLSRTRSLPA